MNIQDIITLCHGQLIQSGTDHEVSSLLTDSRKISNAPSAAFFAIKGPNHDGHNYITDLIKRGVRTFVVEQGPTKKYSEDINLILVKSSLAALQSLAKAKRAEFNKPVIGITGSNGKTIVKEWLSGMLSSQLTVIKSPRSYNSQLGVALSVWEVDKLYDAAVIEAGISLPGEMSKLQTIVQPTHGILTNIGTAHEEGFSSLEDKLSEKLRLFENSSLLIYRSDNSLIKSGIEQMRHPPRQTISWALAHEADVKVKALGAAIYEFTEPETNFALKLPFEDEASLENVIHSIMMLRHFGFSPIQVQQCLDRLEPVDMRLKLLKGAQDNYLIDDSYNNDQAGIETALDFLSHQHQQTEKIVILSDVLQAGNTKNLYERINTMLLEKGVHRLIGVGPEISKYQSNFSMKATFYANTEDLLDQLPQLEFNKSIVLIKGARNFQFERIVNALAEKAHQTVLEINLNAITDNLNFYRSQLEDQVKIMVMVKAFAYGSGSAEVAQLLQFHKVHYLAVAYADEGVSLRKNGIHIPIMVMNSSPADLQTLIQYKLEPEIFEMNQFRVFQEFYQKESATMPIHININTGMNRMGFEAADIPQLADFIAAHQHIEVKSIFTHLAGADESVHNAFSLSQLNHFQELAAKLVKGLSAKPLIHALNSAGIIRFPGFHMDMVRLGIGLYGLEASGQQAEELSTVGTLKTTVSQVKEIEPGNTIGYGRKGEAKTAMRIATVAIGYADGYARAFSNGKGQMSIQGKLVPVIGNVCMDMTMLDVTGLNVKRGDEVIVFGEQPTIEVLAEQINTIPYEILTNVSGRVKRVYLTE